MFSEEDKVLIIKLYYKTESPTIVQREFCRLRGLHTRQGPSRKAVSRVVRHFEEKFSVENKSKGNSGRPSATKDVNIVEEVRQSCDKSPKKSIRRRSAEMNMSRMSMQRILRRELHFYPYVISVRHKMTAQDKARRYDMCQWFLNELEAHPDLIRLLWFTDEAHFHLNGAVNNHNNIFWT